LAGNIGPGSQAILVDAKQQLELYDKLPAKLRVLYDSLPEPEDVGNFQALQVLFGTEGAYGMIVDAIKQQYPGWEEPKL
jgi:hypothetical protein